MRKRKLLVVLAALAVVVAAGAVVLWPRPERVTKENYDRIRAGMTRAEVEAILGPPGDYRTGHGEMDYGGTWLSDPGPGFALRTSWGPGESTKYLRADWMGDSFGIVILIGQSGSVVHKLGLPRRTPQGPLGNLLWRLKRQWRRWFPE
jgi:hypothetical protein